MDIADKPLLSRFWLGRSGLAAGVPAGALLVLATLVLGACDARPLPAPRPGAQSATDVALVRFNNCGDALRNLRAAASSAIGAGEFAARVGPRSAGNAAGASQGSAAASGPGQVSGEAAPGSYSGTNTATAGVDEPDLVKTDGRRIVAVIGGALRVVDAQTRQLTGVLDLSSGTNFSGLMPANLLLAGNHALVLFNPAPYGVEGPPVSAGAASYGAPAGSSGAASPASAMPIIGPRLALVDLSTGAPRIISEYTIDGTLVDARQVGSVARVVVQSMPRIYFPPVTGSSAPAGAASYRAAIAHAELSRWLPRYAVTTGGVRRTGRVGCASTSHPASAVYSGNSMLTVLTFDLSGISLGDGGPVTVVADGDTVYSDGASLYVASRQWTAPPMTGTTGTSVPVTQSASGQPDAPTRAAPQYTAVYKFSIAGPGRPVYEASGTVPGWLLGSSGTAQYSLSAWNGALRVATTSYGAFTAGYEQPPQSAVYVLEQVGDQMAIIGKAGGLGAGEQIYAVRFSGPVGYVVTFRQTDPLYTLDLSDPAQPKVTGELRLNGYSAYLYPVDATRLIGVGQNTTVLGQTTGTQISLFDVSDPAAPVRLAAHDLRFGHSEAEFDPHAFLYWPDGRLLVIPVQQPYGTTPVVQGGPAQGDAVGSWPVSAALVLHVGDHGFRVVGTITHPVTPSDTAAGQIRRSLIAAGALWTLSDAGLKANDIATLTPLAWVPF